MSKNLEYDVVSCSVLSSVSLINVLQGHCRSYALCAPEDARGVSDSWLSCLNILRYATLLIVLPTVSLAKLLQCHSKVAI